MENTRNGYCLKTCREPFQATLDGILEQCLESSQDSSNQPLPMCLSLKKDGLTQEYYWSVGGGALLTELRTLNTGESRSGGAESHLSWILEEPSPQNSYLKKYFLSRKACQGILNRAERKGKTLPENLRQALKCTIHQYITNIEN